MNIILKSTFKKHYGKMSYLSKTTTSSCLDFFVSISSDVTPNALNDFYEDGHAIPQGLREYLKKDPLQIQVICTR